MGEEPRVAAGWEEARGAGQPEFLFPEAIARMWLLGDDVINRSPLKEAYKIGTRPFQVVHGTNDQRVALHQATDLEAVLQASNPASRAWLIEGAEHVQGPFLVTEEYQRRLGAFFRAALGS